MYRYALLAVALLALTKVQAASNSCPWAFGKMPFDETKFVGDWFPISELPSAASLAGEDRRCARVSFELLQTDSGAQMRAQASVLVNNETATAESVHQAYIPGVASMTDTVWKKNSDAKFSDVYDRTVVATDYENYAVVIACKSDFDATAKTFQRNMIARILSRKRTLAGETLKVLTSVLSGYEIDVTLMQKVDQTNC